MGKREDNCGSGFFIKLGKVGFFVVVEVFGFYWLLDLRGGERVFKLRYYLD